MKLHDLATATCSDLANTWLKTANPQWAECQWRELLRRLRAGDDAAAAALMQVCIQAPAGGADPLERYYIARALLIGRGRLSEMVTVCCQRPERHETSSVSNAVLQLWRESAVKSVALVDALERIATRSLFLLWRREAAFVLREASGEEDSAIKLAASSALRRLETGAPLVWALSNTWPSSIPAVARYVSFAKSLVDFALIVGAHAGIEVQRRRKVDLGNHWFLQAAARWLAPKKVFWPSALEVLEGVAEDQLTDAQKLEIQRALRELCS